MKSIIKIIISFIIIFNSTKLFGYTSFFNFGSINKCSQERPSCKYHQSAGCVGSGSYSIDPDLILQGISGYRVSCDMSATPAWTDISTGLILYMTLDSTTLRNEIGQVPLTSLINGSVQTGIRNNSVAPQQFYGQTLPVSNTMTVCSWQKGNYTDSYRGVGRYTGHSSFNGLNWYRLTHMGYGTGVAQQVDGPNTPISMIVATDGLWHHYCATLDYGITTVKTYRDGNLVHTLTNTSRWNSAGTPLKLFEENPEYPTTLAPLLDEYRVYSRVLTKEEIRALGRFDYNDSPLLINGNFSASTGWVGSKGSISGGQAIISTGGVNDGPNFFRQAINTEIGKSYTFTYTFVSATNGSQLSVGAIIEYNDNRNGARLINALHSAPGTYNLTFTATSALTNLVFSAEVQTGTVTIDNVSIVKN